MTEDLDTWTPDLVRDCMVEAVRWLNRYGGRAMPAGYRSNMPDFHLSVEERLAEGWDAVPGWDDLDAIEQHHRPSAGQVVRLQQALDWPAMYLAPVDPALANAVHAACVAEAKGSPFKRELARRNVPRVHGYRLRDRGLSMISQRLDMTGVPIWPSASE